MGHLYHVLHYSHQNDPFTEVIRQVDIHQKDTSHKLAMRIMFRNNTCVFTEVVGDVEGLVVVADVFKVDETDLLCTAMHAASMSNSHTNNNIDKPCSRLSTVRG